MLRAACALCCNSPQVLLVEEEAHLGGALQALRDSMQDPVVAIDLEFEHLQSRPIRVAMMQLASSRVAVLIRTCRMDNKLPKVLSKFLQDPSVCLLGCGWASTDEVIMQRTFGISRKDFGRFLDLQEVGGLFGLQEVGLKQLTRHVLGLELNKNSRGNWEAQRLKPSKVGRGRTGLRMHCSIRAKWRPAVSAAQVHSAACLRQYSS